MTKRKAFTMVELLMVMTVIALMTSLLVGASFRFVASARETATATTVTKVIAIIKDRMQGCRELDMYLPVSEFVGVWNNPAAPKSPVMTARLAEILIRKREFKREFPQCFAEMDANQITRYFGSATIPPTSASYDSRFEPGIVLYAMLIHGRTFGQPSVGEDAFVTAELRSGPETADLPCLVDAWGQSLRFYRWPTRLLKPGENGLGDYNANGNTSDPAGTVDLTSGAFQASPAIRPTGTLRAPTPASLMMANLPQYDISSSYAKGPDGAAGIFGSASPGNTLGWPLSDDPDPLCTDPDDPTMLLATEWFSVATNAIAFVVGSELDTTGTYYVDAYHDPFCFTAPLIVSAGPDKQLGLFEPIDIPRPAFRQSQNFGYLAAPKLAEINNMFDNISNMNQRAGGR